MAHKRGKSWVATGYDRTTKQKRHLGTFPTKREASEVEAQWKLSKRSPLRKETCDSFANRWTDDYPRPRESTNKHNAERVKRFAKDFKGVRLADLDKPTARRWALATPHCLAAVRAMFGDAERDGLVDGNPFAKLRLPGSRGRRDIVALTEEELTQLASLSNDPRMNLNDFGPVYETMILFAGYTGVRPGELFALEWTDLHGHQAEITKALQSKTGLVGPTKNGRPRTVVVPKPIWEPLNRLPRVHPTLVFTSPSGRRWSQPGHHRYWDKLRALAGRPGLDFYELRHCAATMLLERGVTPWDVAVQLGHTDGGQLVQQLYGHPSEAAARQRVMGAWETNPIRKVS